MTQRRKKGEREAGCQARTFLQDRADRGRRTEKVARQKTHKTATRLQARGDSARTTTKRPGGTNIGLPNANEAPDARERRTSNPSFPTPTATGLRFFSGDQHVLYVPVIRISQRIHTPYTGLFWCLRCVMSAGGPAPPRLSRGTALARARLTPPFDVEYVPRALSRPGAHGLVPNQRREAAAGLAAARATHPEEPVLAPQHVDRRAGGARRAHALRLVLPRLLCWCHGRWRRSGGQRSDGRRSKGRRSGGLRPGWLRSGGPRSGGVLSIGL